MATYVKYSLVRGDGSNPSDSMNFPAAILAEWSKALHLSRFVFFCIPAQEKFIFLLVYC